MENPEFDDLVTSGDLEFRSWSTKFISIKTYVKIYTRVYFCAITSNCFLISIGNPEFDDLVTSGDLEFKSRSIKFISIKTYVKIYTRVDFRAITSNCFLIIGRKP